MLARLSALFAEKGRLSGLVIDEHDDMPSSSTFRHRFGSLVRAYQLVGYTPARDYRYIETNRPCAADASPRCRQAGHRGHRAAGRGATGSEGPRPAHQRGILGLPGDRPVSHQRRRRPALESQKKFDQGLRPSITIAVRMDEDNASIRDYYLLPWLEAGSARPTCGWRRKTGYCSTPLGSTRWMPSFIWQSAQPLRVAA